MNYTARTHRNLFTLLACILAAMSFIFDLEANDLFIFALVALVVAFR